MLPPASPDSTATTDVSRRLVLAGLLGAAGAAALPASRASADGYKVAGRLRETYLAAGGSDVLGDPTGREVKVRIDGHSTYAQRYELGTVWWGSGVGKVDVAGSDRVRLDTALNFRPVLGVAGVWRSDDLDHCTPLEERIVRDLGVATMIAMNSGSDPSISGVRRRKYHIHNDGSHLEYYRSYVTLPATRDAVGEVLRTVAKTDRPVLIHCSAGKDRTGWLSDLMQVVAGVPRAVRDADYLATRDYSAGHVELEWLQAARDQLKADFGSVKGYLTEGCGLSAHRYTALRTRLIA